MEREFPVTVSSMCETEVGEQPGIAFAVLLFILLSAADFRHMHSSTLTAL